MGLESNFVPTLPIVRKINDILSGTVKGKRTECKIYNVFLRRTILFILITYML